MHLLAGSLCYALLALRCARPARCARAKPPNSMRAIGSPRALHFAMFHLSQQVAAAAAHSICLQFVRFSLKARARSSSFSIASLLFVAIVAVWRAIFADSPCRCASRTNIVACCSRSCFEARVSMRTASTRPQCATDFSAAISPLGRALPVCCASCAGANEHVLAVWLVCVCVFGGQR